MYLSSRRRTALVGQQIYSRSHRLNWSVALQKRTLYVVSHVILEGSMHPPTGRPVLTRTDYNLYTIHSPQRSPVQSRQRNAIDREHAGNSPTSRQQEAQLDFPSESDSESEQYSDLEALVQDTDSKGDEYARK